MGVMTMLLAGCQTPYQPNGLLGGYQQRQLAPDMYQITVQGNGYTTREHARDILLLRAAELTLQGGYEKFKVTDRQDMVAAEFSSGLLSGPSMADPHGFVTIKLLKANDPEAKDAYDAATIQAQLKPKLAH